MTTDTPQNSPTKFIKRLRIVVTQKEIDEAKVANSNGCMIHLALQRDHPNFKNIWVDKNQVRCTDPDHNCIYTFDMHPRGRVMLLKWDSGEEIKPFDLWLRKPIVREREFSNGAMRPKKGQQHAKHHRGPVPRQTSKEARSHSGRDRVFGRKLWADELAQVRTDLGILETPTPEAQTSE